MSNKFEQLLDYLVNEEHEKANELFHEIVVEKSREIYENMIAEEAEDDEQQDEGQEDDEQDESVEEDSEDDEQDESVDEGAEELEDSYMMDGDDDDDMSPEPSGLEKTDDLGGDLGAMDDEEGGEASEEEAIHAQGVYTRDGDQGFDSYFILRQVLGAPADTFITRRIEL